MSDRNFLKDTINLWLTQSPIYLYIQTVFLIRHEFYSRNIIGIYYENLTTKIFYLVSFNVTHNKINCKFINETLSLLHLRKLLTSFLRWHNYFCTTILVFFLFNYFVVRPQLPFQVLIFISPIGILPLVVSLVSETISETISKYI